MPCRLINPVPVALTSSVSALFAAFLRVDAFEVGDELGCDPTAGLARDIARPHGC